MEGEKMEKREGMGEKEKLREIVQL